MIGTRRLALLKVLESRLGPINESIKIRIQRANSAQIEQWFMKAIVVSCLEDVFADVKQQGKFL